LRFFQIVMGKRQQDRFRVERTTVRMMRNYMRRLRVGLLTLYQVFLDFTHLGSVEYYMDSVSQF